MTSGRIGHWTKMHQSLAKFSESEASNHTPSLADFTLVVQIVGAFHRSPEANNACIKLRFINSKTGKLLGEKNG
jgi:hypothetical protein